MLEASTRFAQPKGPMIRSAFITREIGWLPAGATITRSEHGYFWNGRPYTALRCHCRAAGCPGWTMVHDTPADRTFFERRFGNAQGELALEEARS
jgi:hypothetical protein